MFLKLKFQLQISWINILLNCELKRQTDFFCENWLFCEQFSFCFTMWNTLMHQCNYTFSFNYPFQFWNLKIIIFFFKSNRLSENVVCWRIYKGYPKVTWHGSRKMVITSVVVRGKGSVWPGQCSKTPESTFWTTPCPPLIPAYGFEFLTKFLEIEGCSVKKHESLSPKIKDSCQSWTTL